MAQCSVFAGGFDLDAAESVLDLSRWPDAPEVDEVLESLVDQSLLRITEPAELVGQPLSSIIHPDDLGRAGEALGEILHSGRSFDKGIFMLTGFLRSLYARKSPLGIVASLAFEQSYGKVDGDSATLAEALAIFSELSDLPCRQDIAVTGAVNQRGELMPVGSVNLKVNGWYQSCKQRGLTGTQGILFPKSNIGDLQLDSEVLAAVQRGEFHLYGAATVDDAVEVILGRPFGRVAPGKPFIPGSVYRLTAGRMKAMSERLYPPRGNASKKKPATKKATKGEAASDDA